MTTINLRDGLEALYYFGEQDFNPQRNQLQDHSGYGRHAEADASITFGVNGPNEFEAADLTKSNNDRIVNNDVDYADENEFTTSVLIKAENSNDNSGIGLHDNVFSTRFVKRNNALTIRCWFDGGRIDEDCHFDEYGEYVWLTYHVTPNSVRVYVGEDLRIYRTPNITNLGFKNFSDIEVGRSILTSEYSEDEYAAVLSWSRGISFEEIQRLNDLTAPLRAQL